MLYQKVIRGYGSLRKVSQTADQLQMKHPLIVGSRQLTGLLLKKSPELLQSPAFSTYHSNPDLKDAESGVQMFYAQKCDSIISIGGGSAIDTAKAIKALIHAKSFEEAAKNHFAEKMGIPHLAIPGTAGTGSEATQFAVTYLNHRKLSLNHPDLRPDGIILDAELLETLPDYHKKSCALDALCQGIESYWCTSATEDSKVHAYLAILGVLDNLTAYLNGDLHAAEEMLEASYQSGKAIQITRTTAAHAMSYQLTATMGYAHGHACMITLPALWEMMYEHDEMKPLLQDLSEKMRLGHPMVVPRLLRGIMIDLNMDVPFISENKILDSLADSVNLERLQNHPLMMDRDTVIEAYRRSFVLLSPTEKQACLDIWKYYCQ